jgi:uncharacterized membrane protein YfhO
VFVDGKPEQLLRCNYLMRGVYLQAGSHTVEFRFAPPVTPFYVSLTAVVVGVLLLGCVAFVREKEATPPLAANTASRPKPLHPARQGKG